MKTDTMQEGGKARIAVAGAGYVGLANALALSKFHDVVIMDVDEEKVSLLNEGRSPIADPDIERFLRSECSSRFATSSPEEAFRGADYILIATPTDYSERDGRFDTSSIETVLKEIESINPDACVVIKSTVPVGYTDHLRSFGKVRDLVFSPEFLREGKALHDVLYPSRVVVGGDESGRARDFGCMMAECAVLENVPLLFVSAAEAEAIKLFSNTYLAMRVSFFNELDSFAVVHGLDSRAVIRGVCMDDRIGDFYNNPSFGYGGYCLPKDTKQLLSNFQDVPQNLIRAIVDANFTRKKFIASEIISMRPKLVGIYRLAMKSGSDNFRESSICDVMALLEEAGVHMLVYEPNLESPSFRGVPVVSSLERLKEECDLILANRLDAHIRDVLHKVYSRDVFGRD